MVVVAADSVDRRSVDGGREELLRFEVDRAEHGSVEALGGGARCDSSGEVAGRRARERRQAELLGLLGRDRDDPVLEGVCRVGRVQLQPQLADAELLGQAWSPDERGQARREPRLGGSVDRQQRRVAPDRCRPGGDRLARERVRSLVPVVDGIEGREAARAGADVLECVLGVADAATKCGGGHGTSPFDSLDIRPGLAPCREAGCRGFTGPVPQPLSMRSGSCPLPAASIRNEVTLRGQVEQEARAARDAVASLTDAAVSEALHRASELVGDRRAAILAANRADLDAGVGLDEGLVDRLRVDDARVDALAEQLVETAELSPLEREAATWTLANGKRVTERRIPIGAVGANFEARPNVALDVSGQLLKSLNTALLRTGSAALRTVTMLVDEVLRPALESAGLPPGAVGLVRSPDHEGARVLVSMPKLVPLVILRGSGETTAALARHAAEHGVRTLAHAEGGGVLYVHPSADPGDGRAVVEASIDRLGVCNRLNLCLVDREAEGLAARPSRRCSRVAAIDGAHAVEPIGHEWANDPDHRRQVTLCYLDSLEEAVRVANEETSGLAASIVAEDADAARRFLYAYRGTAAFWNETTRFTDGWKLTGAPETGINVDWTPGPRGPVTYRDLWLRQYRVVGNGTQTPVKRPIVVKLGSSLVAALGRAAGARSLLRARAARLRSSSRAERRSASSRRARSRSGSRGSGSGARPRSCRGSRRPPRSGRRGCSGPGTTPSAATGLPPRRCS